jgi:type I site-specific restriction-modification system R (restriction) subunit
MPDYATFVIAFRLILYPCHAIASSTQLLRQEPRQVENRDQLKELLQVASGGVIFSTIQKFQPDEGNVFDTLSERSI